MSSSPAPASTPPRRPARSMRIPPGANGRAGSGSLTPDARQNPAAARALQLSTFEDEYSTEDFIGTLSEKLIAQSKANPGPFDPVPFMQTFSPALDSLLALRAQVAERTQKMESEVRHANRDYGRRLRELDSRFDDVGKSFSHLEGKISDVGRTAARVGEQLETLHQKRSTAQDTAMLLSYYLSLVHQASTTGSESDSPLEAVYALSATPSGRFRLATILRRLMTLSKDVAENAKTALAEAEAADGKEDAGGNANAVAHRNVLHRSGEREKADRVRDEVEKYCERFETDIRRRFNKSYRRGDPSIMGHCARVLEDFNGGMAVVQIYVNQHHFFLSSDEVLEKALKEDSEANGATDIWKSIGDPDAPPPTSEAGLSALLRQIRDVVDQEAQIHKAVFPNPLAVMERFLRRVFAQVIQQHIESIVARAASISTLAVLRILSLSHAMCSSLVEDLKTHEAALTGAVAGPSRLADTGATGPLAQLLDQALEEIFIPWLEGTRYLDSESKNLVELYAGLLSGFTRYHETILKAKPNSLLTTAPAATAQAAAAAISKYANLFTTSASSAFSTGAMNRPAPPVPSRSASRLSMQRPGVSRADSLRGTGTPGDSSPIEERILPTDGVVKVELAERMLNWHAEAIGRVVELSPSSEIPRNVLALSKVLAEGLGRSFTETALDSALAKLEQCDPRSEPDLGILQVLKPTDLVCHLWQRYMSTALIPLTGTAAVVRRELTNINQHNLVRMEGKTNAVIQKALDGIINWFTVLLARQKRNDYKPKNDELSFARTNTEPCELCCDFLATVKEVSSNVLSGQNQEAFLTEVGVAFHSLLLDHYKKFPVNPTGGLMLTKDLASYQDAITSYGINALNDRFDMLRQLGNTFIVQPDVLRSYMGESHLGRIDARLLKPYLAQRSDWSQFSRSLALDDAPDDAPTSGTATPLGLGSIPISTSARRAGHRLSAMSGVAGAGMAAGYTKLRDALREFENLNEEKKKDAQSSAPPSAFGSRNPSASGAGQKKYAAPMPPLAYMTGMH